MSHPKLKHPLKLNQGKKDGSARDLFEFNKGKLKDFRKIFKKY